MAARHGYADTLVADVVIAYLYPSLLDEAQRRRIICFPVPAASLRCSDAAT